MPQRLTLLMRDECGLCEDMARDLRKLGMTFDTIDIDMDADLERLYGEAIPVLMLDGSEIARVPQDFASLSRILTEAGMTAYSQGKPL